MQTQITARHFEASPSLRDYAAERLSKLQRYYDGITDAHVVLTNDSTPADGKAAEIVLQVYRQTLSARDEASTHEEAIDHCVDRLRRQIMRYKAKLRSTNKHVQR
jgi:putative sigma-54 modulation protein